LRPSRHLALSAGVGVGVWAITGEPWSIPVTLGAGVLVDIDHAPDLWWTFALRRKPTATFLLHGWEWLGTAIAFGVSFGFPWWLLALIVGHGFHLVTDHIFNGGRTFSYSLIYRASQGFQMARVAPGWDFDYAFKVFKKEMPPAAWLIEWWVKRSGSSDCEARPEAHKAEKRLDVQR